VDPISGLHAHLGLLPPRETGNLDGRRRSGGRDGRRPAGACQPRGPSVIPSVCAAGWPAVSCYCSAHWQLSGQTQAYAPTGTQVRRKGPGRGLRRRREHAEWRWYLEVCQPPYAHWQPTEVPLRVRISCLFDGVAPVTAGQTRSSPGTSKQSGGKCGLDWGPSWPLSFAYTPTGRYMVTPASSSVTSTSAVASESAPCVSQAQRADPVARRCD
jgi:hypothetical protein